MGFCRCKPKDKKNWVVSRRNWIASAFNGYRVQYSPFSRIRCLICGALWKTKSNYVKELQDEIKTA